MRYLPVAVASVPFSRPTDNVDVNSSLGYKAHQQLPKFLPMGRGIGAWTFQSIFVVGSNPGMPKIATDCKLIRVRENWELCYRWLSAVRLTNELINADRAVPKVLQKLDGPKDQAVGVIGYDTPLVVPEWAMTLFPTLRSWSDSNFPRLTEQHRLQFGKSGQYCFTAERVVQFVRAKLPTQFARVYPVQLTDRTAESINTFLDDENNFTSALAAWGHHARILYKDKETRTLKVYDPWKQKVVPPSWLSQYATGVGYAVKFVVREADQQWGEGSCQLQATMRVLMASQLGEEGITTGFDMIANPALGIYPVVTQLLYSKMRSKRR